MKLPKKLVILDLAYKILAIILLACIFLTILFGISDHQELMESKARYRKIKAEVEECNIMANCRIMGHGFLKTSIPKKKGPKE